MTVKLQGRRIAKGRCLRRSLVSTQGISFYGGVDPETGVVVEKGHDLEGRSITGKVLVFPSGKGSTVKMALIETRDLYKIYDVGESPVHALDGVSITIERGEVRTPTLQQLVDDMIEMVQEVNRAGTTIMVIEHVMKAIMGISNKIESRPLPQIY
jgi:hypothetical protein